ncbi:MAG: ABC transporter permease [Acidimicrobiia bacterium]
MSGPGTRAEPSRLRSRLLPRDVVGVGTVGLRTRKLRTALTATGIAIGIAALVATMGISSSSRADLSRRLDALGTNRLEVQAGASFQPGSTPALGDDSVVMIRRIAPVQNASGITTVSATVRRTQYVNASETGGISVQATDSDLAATLGAGVREGRFLSAADVNLPTIVLGPGAASTLGITDLRPDPLVYVNGTWFTVVGILDQAPLYPNLDTAAFIGTPIAERLFKTAVAPSSVFVVTRPDQVGAVTAVLPATANPQSPGEVQVSNPSDVIKAKHAADDTLTALLLGLGGVALLVGGIGIANVMVISVLERRTEIGVRRALGATKGHVRTQFLVEAILLSTLGGVLGIGLGVGITAGYAAVQGITFSMPTIAGLIGIGAAIVVGALAGISPAGRAARLAPADAIRPS